MRPVALALLSLAALVALLTVGVRPAAADPFAHRAGSGASPASGSIVVPAEWSGVWTTVDSTYTCTGVFQTTSASTDTLCTGQSFVVDSAAVCTGSADANSFTAHCTSTGEVFTGCQYTITVDSHGTRTSDAFFSVSTTRVTYSGSAGACSYLPPECTQVNTHGTRIAPAPSAYCATPVRPQTWGGMKALYR